MSQYPWDTTEDIASQDDTRYETPGGAQQKIDAAFDEFGNEVELPIANGSIVERHIRSENVSSRTIAQKAIERRHIGTGAVGSQELDPTLLQNYGDIAVQAEFDKRGLNVQKFGAKGDGVTDESIAIQTAINSGAKRIYFPPGVYVINNVLIMNSLSNVEIVGINATIKLGNIATPGDAFKCSLFRIIDCNNIKISGITFDGNRILYNPQPTETFDSFRGIWIVNCENVYINNNIFSNFIGVAIKVIAKGATGVVATDALLPGVRNLKVTDNMFDAVCDACQINPSLSQDIYFQRNKISTVDEHGVTLYPGQYNVHVNYNKFYNIGVKFNHSVAIRFFETLYGSITNNYIERCNTGIGLEDLNYFTPNKGIEVRDNTIVNSGYFFQTNTYGMSIVGEDILLDGNVITETNTTSKFHGIILDGVNIKLKNTKLKYTTTSGRAIRIGYNTIGRYPINKDITLADNTIEGSFPNAVQIQSTGNCQNIEIFKNKISGYLYSAFVDTTRACIFRGLKKKSSFSAVNATTTLTTVNNEYGIPYYLFTEECFVNNIQIYTDKTVTGTITIKLKKNTDDITSALGSSALISVSEIKILVARGKNTDIFDPLYFKVGDKLSCEIISTTAFTGNVATIIDLDVIDYKN